MACDPAPRRGVAAALCGGAPRSCTDGAIRLACSGVANRSIVSADRLITTAMFAPNAARSGRDLGINCGSHSSAIPTFSPT
eukprot:scaffold9730_cov63-Phaeocystis_antarctica.AAC.9